MSGLSASFFLYLLVVCAGVSVALQQVLNANLRVALGSPWWAGFVSFLMGTVIMLVIGLLSGAPQPVESASVRASWLSWTGGVFGAIFVGITILMVQRLGAATVLALIVVGQMLGALVLDHFGLLGLPQQTVSPVRLAGVILLVAGVILVRR